MKKQKIICLIGASDATEDEEKFAYQTGKLIAQKGYILCCGGKGGVMSAACQAAYEQGGLTIGLLPKDDGSDDNGFLSIGIPTGIGHARNKMIADTADAIIAVGGSYGTLSEIAYARIKNKTVFAYKSWRLFQNGQETVDDGIIEVNTPQEAVDKAIECIKKE